MDIQKLMEQARYTLKFICFRLFIDLFSNHPTIRLDDLSFSTKFKM